MALTLTFSDKKAVCFCQLFPFQKHGPLVVFICIFFFFWEWLHLLSFSLRCYQIWMDRDTLLVHLMFLWLERGERNKANRDACRGLQELPWEPCEKSGLSTPPLMGITKKRAWEVDSNNWVHQHAQKPFVFTLGFSKGWTHLPKCLFGKKILCVKRYVYTEKQGHISTYSFVITLP